MIRITDNSTTRTFPAPVFGYRTIIDMPLDFVKLESGKTVRVTIPNLSRLPGDRITWEETVHLSWHPSSGVVLTQ